MHSLLEWISCTQREASSSGKGNAFSHGQFMMFQAFQVLFAKKREKEILEAPTYEAERDYSAFRKWFHFGLSFFMLHGISRQTVPECCASSYTKLKVGREPKMRTKYCVEVALLVEDALISGRHAIQRAGCRLRCVFVRKIERQRALKGCHAAAYDWVRTMRHRTKSLFSKIIFVTFCAPFGPSRFSNDTPITVVVTVNCISPTW